MLQTLLAHGRTDKEVNDAIPLCPISIQYNSDSIQQLPLVYVCIHPAIVELFSNSYRKSPCRRLRGSCNRRTRHRISIPWSHDVGSRSCLLSKVVDKILQVPSCGGTWFRDRPTIYQSANLETRRVRIFHCRRQKIGIRFEFIVERFGETIVSLRGRMRVIILEV